MNYFENLGRWISFPINESRLPLASLYLDQFMDMNISGIKNKSIEAGLTIHWLHSIFEKIQDQKSIIGQTESKENYADKLMQRINNFEQKKIKLRNSSFEYLVSFISAGPNPENNKYLKTSLIYAINKNPKFEHPLIFSNAISDWQLRSEKESYSIVVLIPYTPPYEYNHPSCEYDNNLAAYIVQNTVKSKEKKFLFSFEYLPDINQEQKEIFLRSFIRSMLVSNLYNNNIDFGNVYLQLESEKDRRLFNKALNRIEELIRYNSSENKITEWNKFFDNHPSILLNKLHNLSSRKIITKSKASTDYISSVNFEKPLSVQGKVKTKSRIFEELLARITIVAKAGYDIFLLGETGTGKTEIAKQIHLSRGLPEEKFIALNCSAIPDTLIESEVFGYEVGSQGVVTKKFDGKIKFADGGTLFLDEIGKSSINFQQKLLKFLETRTFYKLGSNVLEKVSVQIIFAANEKLSELYSEGKLLQDLYFRISNATYTIPNINERKEDIIDFVNEFIQRYQSKFNFSLELSNEVQNYLVEQRWPGNIRQIDGTIFQIFVFCILYQIHEFTIDNINKIRIDSHLESQSSTFSDYENSFKDLFQDYYTRRKDLLEIPIVSTNKSTKVNQGQNYHSFLKLVVEPIAANHFASLNLTVHEASSIIGLEATNGENSTLKKKALLYHKIKEYFK